MKKTYNTPAVTMNGSVVQETRFSNQGETELVGKKIQAGSIGFNL